MFDFRSLTETFSGVLGGVFPGGGEPVTQIMESLQSAGLDPSVLAGLSENEIVNLLSEHGIDPTPFLGEPLSGLLENLGLGGEGADHG